jgi:hypothetical protein
VSVAEGVAGLSEIVTLSSKGIELTEALQRVINDPSLPARLLGEIGKELAAVDEQIEAEGLSKHMLGALIRMFVMEKENMRGNDPRHLASEMQGIYSVLRRRVERFSALFNHYSEGFQSEGRC